MPTISLKSIFALAAVAIMAVCTVSCNNTYVPKPRGYYKIDFPQHQYQVFDRPGFPYRFEYPVYAVITQDSTYFEDQPENPYWINIDFPRFQGKIYISYIQIGGKRRFKVRNARGQYIDSIGI